MTAKEKLTVRYRGHIEKGVIVLDEPADLQEGTVVSVEVLDRDVEPGDAALRYARFKHLIGAIEDMPADWSEEHDKYLRKEYES